MKISTKVVYNWNDRLGCYILIEDLSRKWTGNIAYCKGAGSQLTDISQSQQDFMNTLQKDFGTAFSGQQNIISSLTSALTPILQGGVNQYGYSPSETNALNTQATTGTATQYRNAAQAAGQAASAVGGGNAVLPSSAAAQTQAGIAQSAAQQTSSQLLGIKTAGYEAGRQNFNNAVSGLTGVASLENPTAYASAANTAGSTAANTAQQVQTMNNASSPWNVVGGILGGVVPTLANITVPGISSAFGAVNKSGATSANPAWGGSFYGG